MPEHLTHGDASPLTSAQTAETPPTELTPFTIPRIIFDELSAKLGIGEPFDVTLSIGTFRCVRLNPASPLVNGHYAIAIDERQREGDGYCRLTLFDSIPKQEQAETVFEAEPYLQVRGAAVATGGWAIDLGNRKREIITVDMTNQNLGHPAATIAGLIVVRTHQLLTDPTCIARTFWDGMGDTPP